MVHLATVSCWHLHTGVKDNSLEIGDPDHAGDLDAMKSDLDAGDLDEMEAQSIEHRNSNYFGRLSKRDLNAGELDQMEAQNVTMGSTANSSFEVFSLHTAGLELELDLRTRICGTPQ